MKVRYYLTGLILVVAVVCVGAALSIEELRPHAVVGWNGNLQLISIEFYKTGNA